MIEIFGKYPSLILFLHLISVAIWIGGMIVMRFAVHYSILKIDEAKVRLERTLENLKKFFYMVIISIVLIYFSAIVMHISFDLKANSFAIAKEIILLAMTLVFIFIFTKRHKAEKYFKKNEFVLTKKTLEPISKYLIPINIFLGLIEIYLGIVLRGF